MSLAEAPRSPAARLYSPPAPVESPPPLRRLDPERALTEPAGGEAPAESEPAPAAPPPPPPSAVDTRRYRWAIGIFGLALVIGLSVYGFARNGVGSPGVTAGRPLHRFVAPLATGPLVGDVNTRPRCDPARPLAPPKTNGIAETPSWRVCDLIVTILTWSTPRTRSST